MRRATKIGVGSLVAGALIAGAFLWLSIPPIDRGISPADKAATQPTKKPTNGLLYARGAVIVGALALINLFTWSGYPWVMWPAGVLIALEFIRRVGFRSH